MKQFFCLCLLSLGFIVSDVSAGCQTCSRIVRVEFGWWYYYSTQDYQCRCSVDGQWSSYDTPRWSTCSVSCGSGTEVGTRHRYCNNPAPQHGGNYCGGSPTTTVTRPCNRPECPVDGGWSEYDLPIWTGQCSVTCGMGIEQGESYRYCNNPKPDHGGRHCIGEYTKPVNKPCSRENCPIDGGWTEYSEFSEWSGCSLTCGIGEKTRERSRNCTNPKPQFGGTDCEGKNYEIVKEQCDMKACPDTICAAKPTGTHTAHLQSRINYLQCENSHAHVKNCPKGTFWDEQAQTCNHPKNTTGLECNTGDHLPHESDCSKYYICAHNKPVERTCPEGLYWSNEKGNCDHASQVNCKNGGGEEDEGEIEDDGGFTCPSDGLFSNPSDNTKYIHCSNGIPYNMSCPTDTQWKVTDPGAGYCEMKTS